MQFLVGRLQFLLGSLHFLVCTLQFFVGGLSLFVRGTELFDDRLEILARRRQFLLQSGVFLLERPPWHSRGTLRRTGCLVVRYWTIVSTDQNQKVLGISGQRERDYRNRDRAVPI